MDEKNKEKIVRFFREMLEVYDFQIIIDTNKDLENVFRLNDIQKGNLGGIEEEEFLTLADIIYRLEIYHKDYVYTPLEEKDNEKLERDDWDLVAKRYLESDTVAKVLSEIGTKEYLALINENKEFKIQDIIKILDEDEKVYKSICKKYMCAMPKVTENIATIYEIYDNVKENLKENKVEKEEDFDYEDK